MEKEGTLNTDWSQLRKRPRKDDEDWNEKKPRTRNLFTQELHNRIDVKSRNPKTLVKQFIEVSIPTKGLPIYQERPFLVRRVDQKEFFSERSTNSLDSKINSQKIALPKWINENSTLHTNNTNTRLKHASRKHESELSKHENSNITKSGKIHIDEGHDDSSTDGISITPLKNHGNNNSPSPYKPFLPSQKKQLVIKEPRNQDMKMLACDRRLANSQSHSVKQLIRAERNGMPKFLTKTLFERFICTRKVTMEALDEVYKGVEEAMSSILSDVSTYSKHARRKKINATDVEVLLRRQRFVDSNNTLSNLARSMLSFEDAEKVIHATENN